MNALSDNALLLKVKSGDLDKMALLFHRYHRPLYGFLFHMTGQRQKDREPFVPDQHRRLGKINGGGPEMMMKTMQGNIYIRKAK